jgi:hypothetical protein
MSQERNQQPSNMTQLNAIQESVLVISNGNPYAIIKRSKEGHQIGYRLTEMSQEDYKILFSRDADALLDKETKYE